MNYNLPKIRGKYKLNHVLKTWFDVGGACEVVFFPSDLDDLIYFLKNIDKAIPLTIIGAASNVIVSDSGIKGVVIKLPAEFAKISNQGNLITAGAASLCGSVALYSKNAGLTGLEFFSGIPGSVGGAIAMNAGCYGGDVSQKLISAKAINFSGEVFELKNSDFGFFYRGSKISTDFIFVEATFKLEESSAEIVGKNIFELSKKREEAQPIRAKTGGSTFKNPENNSAWKLIDEAGYRGKTIGGAKFSEKHCNFMINYNNAKAQDLIDLASLAKKAVKEKSGVDLQMEIKILS